MHAKALSGILAVLPAVLGGCAGGQSQPQNTPPVPALMVPERETGAIAVEPGRKMTVRLETRRSAGYRWALASSGDALEQLGEPFYAEERIPGGDGAEYWSFLARRPGKQDLHFEYRRPWEKEKPPARTATYTINVGEQR